MLVATPQFLMNGTSLDAFVQWCGDERNLVVLPKFVMVGTPAASLLRGSRVLSVGEEQVAVRCELMTMPFSAHADFLGLMQFISCVSPLSVLLCHGDRARIDLMRNAVWAAFRIPTVVQRSMALTLQVERDTIVRWDLSQMKKRRD